MTGLLKHTTLVVMGMTALVILRPAVAELAGPAGARSAFSITALRPLPGTTQSEATGINNRGHVVGSSYMPESRAVLWASGTVIPLDTTGPFYAARDINNRGQIVGWGITASGELHAMLWKGGIVTDLGTLGGGYSSANAINDRGQIVGSSDTALGEQHAFLWEDGVMLDLGTLPGTGYIPGSIAWDINSRGQVVGVSSVASPTPLWVAEAHGFLWENGLMIDLGRLPDGTFSSATAINARGDITGLGNDSSVNSRFGLLWRHGVIGKLTADDGMARAINARGQVVGEGLTASGQTRAILWADGGRIDLGTLPGDTGSRAWDINDGGQIVGQTFADGRGSTAVIWTRR